MTPMTPRAPASERAAQCGELLGRGPAMCVLPLGHDGFHEWRERPTVTTDPLDEFVANAALHMRDRLAHGAKKFGATSWRAVAGYSDDENQARLLRAVEHLWSALDNDAGPDETAKRAADVANQAFMYADPQRNRR